jgi:hypothetical protein
MPSANGPVDGSRPLRIKLPPTVRYAPVDSPCRKHDLYHPFDFVPTPGRKELGECPTPR